jgi:hypothetical protein
MYKQTTVLKLLVILNEDAPRNNLVLTRSVVLCDIALN